MAGPISLPGDLPFAALVTRTFVISTIAALSSIIGAYPLALVWRFSDRQTSRAIIILMVLPLIMGFLARNYSWIGMLSSERLLASMGWSLVGGSQILYTQFSVCFVMSCVFIPIAFFILIQGAASVSEYHVDAARTLGVPDWKIVIYIMVPLTFRAAILGFGLILAMAAGFFVTPNMIGGGKVDFVSNAILAYVNFGLFGYASIVALSFLAVMLIPVVLLTAFAMHRRLRVTGR